MTGKPTKRIQVVCEAIVLPEGAEPPTRAKVVPWGKVELRSGKPAFFIMDEVAAKEMLAEFAALGRDLIIDREHQVLGGEYTSPDGSALAAGWIKSLDVVVGDGIYADVEWTPWAIEKIAAREYRFLSPVCFLNPNTLRAVVLHSVALTNDPAILGMVPLVNKESLTSVEPVTEDSLMDEFITQMKELLKLGEEATPEQMLEVVRVMLQKIQTFEVAPEEGAAMAEAIIEVVQEEISGESAEEIKEATEEAADEGAGAVAEAVASSLRGVFARLKHPKGMVDADALATLNREKADLLNRVNNIEFDRLVATNSARLPAARRAKFRKLWEKDRRYAEEWLSEQPELVANTSGGDVAGAPIGRDAVIVTAKSSFTEETATRAVTCSQRAWVNMHLRDAGANRLTDDEASKHGVS